jgi:hypothetical protein
VGTLLPARGSRNGGRFIAWLPVVVLPTAAIWLSIGWPAWGRMWLMAVAIYAGFKWLTFATSQAARGATWGKTLGYLLLWTGMDAEAFFGNRADENPPRWSEWAWSIAQLSIGFLLLVGCAPALVDPHPLLAGWLALTGVVSILHFGVSHWLSLIWRSLGVSARHIMDKPVLAKSASDFWGQRWNLAFRDLMYRFVLRPLVPSVGVAWATALVFLVSGLIHDAVISFTAGGGWGLPTLYFVIQAGAVYLERSSLGRRLGLGRGFVGWLFAFAVIAGPAGLLFHRPFIEHVVVPMVRVIQGSAL